jgi:peptidoglycan/LPS O-acetylase OafA/YrhL
MSGATIQEQAPERAGTGRSAVRREIQAVRALAVAGVVAFHLWPESVSGGYVGVDVFFVVSGFLITAHLLKEAQRSGTVILRQFWARRIRRLLPAAFLTIALTVAAVVLVVPRSFWPNFMKEAIASTLYFENWSLAADSVDYLAAENAASPFQHYWSLAVEEQFYLVWPLVVLAVVLLATPASLRRGLTIAMAVIAAASLGYGIWATVATPSVAYFSSFTRAWQFAAGALLALTLGSRVVPKRWSTLTSLGAFVMIVAAMLLYDGGTPFPGYAALLPVVGGALAIAAGMPSWRPAHVVASDPRVQWLGDVSYSAYLLHFPPIIILPYVTGHELTVLEKLAILVATLVGAGLMKRFVEDRFRVQGPLVRTWPTFAVVLAVMVLLVGGALGPRGAATGSGVDTQRVLNNATQIELDCVGFAAVDPATAEQCTEVHLADVVPDRLTVADDVPVVYDDECRTSPTSADLKMCTFGDKTSDTVAVLVGDSHAAQWFPAVQSLAIERGWRLEVFYKAACSFSEAAAAMTEDHTRDSCVEWNSEVMDQLAVIAPSYVFTSAVAGHEFANANGEVDGEVAIAGYANRWSEIGAQGASVIVFVDTPQMTNETVACVAASEGPEPDCATDRSYALGRPDHLTPAAARVADVTLIDINDYLCTSELCPAVMGSVVAYRDTSSHMTKTFTESLTPFVDRSVE